MSTLWIVATPIGNLEDITFRALSTLKEADVVACEDTRHSQKLLSHFDIHKPLLACFAFRERAGAEKVCAALDSGKNVAYVSDAGTPSLSDPGSLLARLALERGHSVVPIPGASAFACLLSVAGMGGTGITFEGFLSPKPGRRRRRLTELMGRAEAVVLYESPFRILKLLADIVSVDPSRDLVVGREMTKIHEEFLRGRAEDVLATLSSREVQKGEFALIVAGGDRKGGSGESGEGDESEEGAETGGPRDRPDGEGDGDEAEGE